MMLTRVTDPQVIQRAKARVRSAFVKRGRRSQGTIGYQGGNVTGEVIWCEDLGVWLCLRENDPRGKQLNRYCCWYGVEEPGVSTSMSISVEVNLPRTGLDRRVSGSLGRDVNGKLFVCHTGRLGGNRGAGTLEQFKADIHRSSVSMDDGDGKCTDAYPIAQVGHDRFVDQMCEFVHHCEQFKRGNRSQSNQATQSVTIGSEQEFEGIKKMPARSAHTSICDHGIVVNRLRGLLENAGCRVGRDVRRDLFIGKSKNPDMQFEAKTSSDTYSIYTAVGQLAVHGTVHPAKQGVLVLPDDVADRHVKAIRQLGLKLIKYRWGKSKIYYSGLDKLVPGVATSAPIIKK